MTNDARTQAIETIANLGFTNGDEGVILDALLAARIAAPCEICDGAGGFDQGHDATPFSECSTCAGTGFVDGGPLILLEPKQVGWFGRGE